MNNDISVSIPLSSLNELFNMVSEYPRLKTELIQLRRQVEGLRTTYNDCLDCLGTIQDKIYGLEGERQKR